MTTTKIKPSGDAVISGEAVTSGDVFIPGEMPIADGDIELNGRASS